MDRDDNFMRFFTELTAENLQQINDVFAPNAHFKDPFNDVNGIDAIQNVFTHMFATTERPKFSIKHYASNQQTLFIQWQFSFGKNKTMWLIDGSSMVTFNDNNQVQEHIDYWDPAEQIYSKVGILRPLMNFLKSRLTAS
ncbi:nuclear transport factor 2 family protein [uncultured Cocleimonas sp.]|uniref:nuclear transport factor 2 family protein n=1 Tax=uncultured Cocleimonas sp. TaxID=1051587 RepID=UPI0026343EEB|nr:nuclear transport factor 2 family protein [uncultured Cocleimonas sp.]